MNPAWVLALSGAQHVLHQVLALDAKSTAAFTPLNQRSIRVSLTQPAISLTIEFENGKPWLSWNGSDEDVRLTGDLNALLASARALAKGDSALVMEGLQVEGSVGVLKALSDAFAGLDLDVEDELSKRLGDPAAGALLMGLKAVYRTLKTQSDTAREQAQEFVRHEQPWFLARDAFEDFSDRARRLRHRIERLERSL